MIEDKRCWRKKGNKLGVADLALLSVTKGSSVQVQHLLAFFAKIVYLISIYLLIYIFYFFIYLFIYLFTYCIYVCVCVCVCVCVGVF